MADARKADRRSRAKAARAQAQAVHEQYVTQLREAARIRHEEQVQRQEEWQRSADAHAIHNAERARRLPRGFLPFVALVLGLAQS